MKKNKGKNELISETGNASGTEAAAKKRLTKKQKRVVLIAVAAFLVVAILATSLSLFFVYRSKGPFYGVVTEAESGLPVAGVMVTDGRNVVKTDSDGKFALDGYYDSTFVTVTIPSGYNCEAFYLPVSKDTESYEFRLTETDRKYENGHSFLQISDSEINENGVGAWRDHVKGLVEELDPAFLIHTGDICYIPGLKQHIKDMNSENMGIPVRYVIGNHDYADWGNYGEALYESLYGPVWYSFDVGNVHYVVTPFQNGGDEPSGYNKNDRWKWLENDLAAVDPDMKVVVFNHTLPPSEDYVVKYGTKSLDLKDHNLIAWVFGHYHYDYIQNNNGILNISTARPDCGGIDSSVGGTRRITVAPDGSIETEMYYYDFDVTETLPDPENTVWSNVRSGNVLFCDTLLSDGTVYVGTSDDDMPRECGVSAVDAATGETKWFFKTVNSVKNKLILSDGIVVAMDAEGWVYGLDAASGGLRWQRKVGLGNSLGTSSGIAADGGTVYVGCAAEVSALKIADGSLIWNKNRNHGENSPAEFVVAGDRLLVGSHWDALVALDKNTGKQLWENRDANLRFRSSTPVAVDENTVLVADDNAIMLVDLANGKMIWKQNYVAGEGKEKVNVYKFDSSSQPYVKDGVAYIATANKGVVAFDVASRTIRWNTLTGKSLVYTAPYSNGEAATVESSFAEKDGCLIFGANDGYLYQMRMSDGEIVKKRDVGAPIFGRVALDGGDVIVSDFSGRILKLTF